MSKVNLHNFLFAGISAVLFLLLLKLANRTPAARLPIVGNVLQLAEQAA